LQRLCLTETSFTEDLSKRTDAQVQRFL